MLRYVFIAVLTTCISKAVAQSHPCNCGAVVDPDFKGKLLVYERPHGNMIKGFQHNFRGEGYLILSILKDSSEHFFVDVSTAIESDVGKTGWIKKSILIGTYARNYSPGELLHLYSKPTTSSKVRSIVPDWYQELYTIIKCSGEWAYVRIRYKGEVKEGWLQPDLQCANPYTTCN
jgi:hypothetical protein